MRGVSAGEIRTGGINPIVREHEARGKLPEYPTIYNGSDCGARSASDNASPQWSERTLNCGLHHQYESEQGVAHHSHVLSAEHGSAGGEPCQQQRVPGSTEDVPDHQQSAQKA
jgi:hypothetical protein